MTVVPESYARAWLGPGGRSPPGTRNFAMRKIVFGIALVLLLAAPALSEEHGEPATVTLKDGNVLVVRILERREKAILFKASLGEFVLSYDRLATINGEKPKAVRKAEPEGPDHRSRDQPARVGAGHAKLPDGTRRFSGKVLGEVVELGHENTILFKIQKPTHAFHDNKASKPMRLIDITVRIGPGMRARSDGARRFDENGRYRFRDERRSDRQDEMHAMFLRNLKPGMTLSLEVKNNEGNYFNIISLTSDNRKWAQEKFREAMQERRDSQESGNLPEWRDGGRRGPNRGRGRR